MKISANKYDSLQKMGPTPQETKKIPELSQ